jgi:hypothetical protein
VQVPSFTAMPEPSTPAALPDVAPIPAAPASSPAPAHVAAPRSKPVSPQTPATVTTVLRRTPPPPPSTPTPSSTFDPLLQRQ